MSSQRGPRPLKVAFTIVIALMLTIAPVPEWAQGFRPDWLALTLIYWSMNSPQKFGVGWAWLTGLLLDVAQGTLLGQHALALTLIIYVTVKFHLQMRQFPTLQLSATVFALLALYQFILFWVNGVAGLNAPAVSYWGPVIAGSLIWPLVTMVFTGSRFGTRSS
jgi:rod shape-determining protein MreD